MSNNVIGYLKINLDGFETLYHCGINENYCETMKLCSETLLLQFTQGNSN